MKEISREVAWKSAFEKVIVILGLIAILILLPAPPSRCTMMLTFSSYCAATNIQRVETIPRILLFSLLQALTLHPVEPSHSAGILKWTCQNESFDSRSYSTTYL